MMATTKHRIGQPDAGSPMCQSLDALLLDAACLLALTQRKPRGGRFHIGNDLELCPCTVWPTYGKGARAGNHITPCSPRCSAVRETIERLASQLHLTPSDIYREADRRSKRRRFTDVRIHLDRNDVGDNRPGRSTGIVAAYNRPDAIVWDVDAPWQSVSSVRRVASQKVTG